MWPVLVEFHSASRAGRVADEKADRRRMTVEPKCDDYRPYMSDGLG